MVALIVSRGYIERLRELKSRGFRLYEFAYCNLTSQDSGFVLFKTGNKSQTIIGYLKDGQLHRISDNPKVLKNFSRIKKFNKSIRYPLHLLANLQFEGCPYFVEFSSVIMSPINYRNSVNGIIKLSHPVCIYARDDDEALSRLAKYLPRIFEVWNNLR